MSALIVPGDYHRGQGICKRRSSERIWRPEKRKVAIDWGEVGLAKSPLKRGKISNFAFERCWVEAPSSRLKRVGGSSESSPCYGGKGGEEVWVDRPCDLGGGHGSNEPFLRLGGGCL